MCPSGKSSYLDCEILQRLIIKELLPLIQFLFGLDSLKLTKKTLSYIFQLNLKPGVSKKAVSVKKTNFYAQPHTLTPASGHTLGLGNKPS